MNVGSIANLAGTAVGSSDVLSIARFATQHDLTVDRTQSNRERARSDVRLRPASAR